MGNRVSGKDKEPEYEEHRHLVGIGDNICEYCGIDVYTGKVPMDRPYKLFPKRSK